MRILMAAAIAVCLVLVSLLASVSTAHSTGGDYEVTFTRTDPVNESATISVAGCEWNGNNTETCWFVYNLTIPAFGSAHAYLPNGTYNWTLMGSEGPTRGQFNVSGGPVNVPVGMYWAGPPPFTMAPYYVEWPSPLYFAEAMLAIQLLGGAFFGVLLVAGRVLAGRWP